MQGEKHILAVLLFKSVGFVLFVVVVVSIQNISPSFPHLPQPEPTPLPNTHT